MSDPCPQRVARSGEKCACGRPAVVVYLTDDFGEVGYCGIPDGGQNQQQQLKRQGAVMNIAKAGILAAIIIAALALAGCGSKQDQTKTAAACLRNALASDFLGEKGNSCGDSSAYRAEQMVRGMKFSATCTHQNANQYICDVTGPATSGGYSLLKGGFYAVTFDGASIVFQPTEGNS